MTSHHDSLVLECLVKPYPKEGWALSVLRVDKQGNPVISVKYLPQLLYSHISGHFPPVIIM